MNKISQFLNRIGLSLIFWVIALSLHTFIRYYGVYEEPGVHTKFDFEFTVVSYLKYGCITGLIFGIFYGITSIILDEYFPTKFHMLLKLLVESILNTFLFAIAWTISLRLWDYEMGTNLFSSLFWWVETKFFFANVVYGGYISFGFSFLKIAIEKFGKGVFLKILLGKYRLPREEERIFMFLDLKSSTTYAEKLGHFKYSRMIQDCFIDLNKIIIQHDAEIYQYVGDEAVLTWSFDKGIRNNNCIDLFFSFKRLLMSKKEYYYQEYGLLPIFKAGIHGGQLIVAEVGVVKKEIAYHGDIINSTARIQSLCNHVNHNILISKELLNELILKKRFETFDLGNFELKGKDKKMNIFGIELISK